jgi:hypothetical protein
MDGVLFFSQEILSEISVCLVLLGGVFNIDTSHLSTMSQISVPSPGPGQAGPVSAAEDPLPQTRETLSEALLGRLLGMASVTTVPATFDAAGGKGTGGSDTGDNETQCSSQMLLLLSASSSMPGGATVSLNSLGGGSSSSRHVGQSHASSSSSSSSSSSAHNIHSSYGMFDGLNVDPLQLRLYAAATGASLSLSVGQPLPPPPPPQSALLPPSSPLGSVSATATASFYLPTTTISSSGGGSTTATAPQKQATSLTVASPPAPRSVPTSPSPSKARLVAAGGTQLHEDDDEF